MSTKIRVAIAGVGNCASSLVQGVEYYRHADPSETVPGLMHVRLGGYHVGDVEFVAAFDVDAAKVGLDLGKAIFSGQNNTIRFAPVGEVGVTVQRGPTMDGLGKYYRQTIEESPAEPVDVTEVLRRTGADVLVSYLPVGSEQAQKHYAQCAIDAQVAFVNAIPVFIASDPVWAQKFTDAGVPIIGDDIKSQVGATIVHRILARLFEDRGMVLDRTYQLNVGGNMDFKNMLERERLESKKISKTQSVTSQIDNGIAADDVHIGPSDHVPWLEDRKWAYIRLEGRNFGDVPLNVELKLEVWDSPNSAGVIIDAVRCAKLAKDRGIGGPLIGPSSYFMKSPPEQFHDDVAHQTGGRLRRRALVARQCRRTTPPPGTVTPPPTRSGAELPTSTAHYGPDIPTESELRLLGDLKGKRVLELGCGGAQCSIAFAKQGATAIGVDFSAEQLAFARRLCEREEVRIELRQGDLADLAFLRADSIDLVFSGYAFGYVDDLNRVFRQVHRVLEGGRARWCSRSPTRPTT